MSREPGPQMQVAGLPVFLGANADGFFITATFQNVFIYGSPLVVDLAPPVATVETINAPSLLLALIAALSNGATIAVV